MLVILRRYQKWFWAGIIAVVIPSFVVFFTPDAMLPGRYRSNSFGYINGRAIPQEEYAQAYNEASLRYFFSYGTFPSGDEARRMGIDFDIDRETRSRVLMIELMKQNHIQASDEAIGKWIATAFQDRRQHVFHPESVASFIKKIGSEKGLREADFMRFVAHEIGIQQLVGMYGTSGKLVTPQEGEFLYRREHQEFVTEAAIFSGSNYLAQVIVTTNALADFYKQQLATYRIPERVQVRYLRFNLTNYMAEAEQQLAKETNLTQLIQGYYIQQGANFFTDTNGTVLPEAAAKDRIKDQLRREYALRTARQKAGAFAVDLFKMTPPNADNLNAMAATNGFRVEITEPFSEYEIPRGLRVLENFAKTAFALTSEEPIAGPLLGEDGVYIIALQRKLPAEIPPLESVKANVTEYFRRVEAQKLARQAGRNFGGIVIDGITKGKTFDALCSEAKISPIQVPKFSLSSRAVPDLDERLDASALRDIVASVPVGKASRFTDTRDGGFVLYVKNEVPVDEATLKKELPDYLKSLRQSRQFEAFQEWLNREAILARLSAPETKSTTKTQ